MSRNAKLILIVVLAVVLVACVVLAVTLPKKNDGSNLPASGETNDAAVQTTDDTEPADTEGSVSGDLDITIGVESTDPTKSTEGGNSNSGNSDGGNSNSGNANSEDSEDEDSSKKPTTETKLEINFEDLLNGGKKDEDDKDSDANKENSASTEATEGSNGSGGPAKVEDQDIVIEF